MLPRTVCHLHLYIRSLTERRQSGCENTPVLNLMASLKYLAMLTKCLALVPDYLLCEIQTSHHHFIISKISNFIHSQLYTMNTSAQFCLETCKYIYKIMSAADVKSKCRHRHVLFTRKLYIWRTLQLKKSDESLPPYIH